MKIEALALDLDGTLTNSDKRISQRTKDAILKIINQDIRIILASGRPTLGIRPIAKELRLDVLGGFVLAYNGGQIIEFPSGKTIFEKLLPIEYYEEICEFMKAFQLHTLTYDSECVVCENDSSQYVKQEAFNNSTSIQKVPNIVNAINKPVVKFMAVGEPSKVKEALEKGQEFFRNRVNLFLSEPYFLEIMPLNIEKAEALKFLTEYLEISQENIAACGDGLNDISMLKYAGYAVAMDNAYPEVKRVADYITASNNDDGVAQYIEQILINK